MCRALIISPCLEARILQFFLHFGTPIHTFTLADTHTNTRTCMIWPSQLSCLGSSVGRARPRTEYHWFESSQRLLFSCLRVVVDYFLHTYKTFPSTSSPFLPSSFPPFFSLPPPPYLFSSGGDQPALDNTSSTSLWLWRSCQTIHGEFWLCLSEVTNRSGVFYISHAVLLTRICAYTYMNTCICMCMIKD